MKTKWIVIALLFLATLEIEAQVGEGANSATATTQPTVPFKEEIELLPGGAIARFGPHQVTFSADAKTSGAITLRMPSGEWLRSTVFGLVYFSPDWKHSALIAELKSTEGELLPDNRVLYRNAFEGEGVEADILYTYTRQSLEQDIIIRKKIPGPEEYDLPHNCRLGVMTEFMECPVPQRVSGVVDLREHNLRLGVEGEEGMQDDTLIFGESMRIVAGKAFILGQAGLDVPVAKSWMKFDERDSWFLVEATPYALLEAQLDALPRASIQRTPRGQMADVRSAVWRPTNRVATQVSTNVIRLAKADINATPGVVLDYLIVNTPVKTDAADEAAEEEGVSKLKQNGAALTQWQRAADMAGAVAGQNPRMRRRIADTSDVIRLRVFTPLK